MKGEYKETGEEIEDGQALRGGPQKTAENTKDFLKSHQWPDSILNQLISALPLGIYIVEGGRFKMVSPGYQAITGYSEKELLGLPSLEIVHPQDRQRVRNNAVAMLKTGQRLPYEFRILTKQGKIRWIMETVVSIDLGGRKATLGNFMDITERKKAQEALEESEALLTAILSSSPLGIGLVKGRTIQWTNETMVELFRCNKPTDLVGKNVEEFYLSGEEYRKSEEIISAGLSKEGSTGVDLRFKRLDGTVFDAHIKVAPLKKRGEEERFVATISDVSWRKETEKALIREKQRLTVTLRSISDGVIVTDSRSAITLMNEVAEELLGWKEEDVIGRRCEEVFRIAEGYDPRVKQNYVQEVLHKGCVLNLPVNTSLESRDGTKVLVEGSISAVRDKEGRIYGCVIVFRDLSEKRRLEEEIARMQKLEAIGTLAGGIAHDFNNMLMGILGYLTLARMDLEDPRSVLENLEKAEKACMRAKGLASRLLTFSKGGELVSETLSTANFLKDSINLALSGSSVEVNFIIPEGLWDIHGDEVQLTQVVHNIVHNAVEAMKGKGTIYVKAENIRVGEQSCLPLKRGRYVKILVQDHGPGIAEENLGKVFDPFFSTKEMGRGLGLSICHSIVKKHGGHIQIESSWHTGTSITIYLPALELPKRYEISKAEEDLRPRLRVLLMDDEATVRETTAKMLEHFGHDVDCAKDGAEAVELYKRAKELHRPYDVVVLDLTVPGGMGGVEAAKELVNIDPGAKMIVSSGYSTDPVMSQFSLYGFKAAMTKPYDPRRLDKVIRELAGRAHG